MADFEAKMHQIRFGAFTALPKPPSWISGASL